MLIMEETLLKNNLHFVIDVRMINLNFSVIVIINYEKKGGYFHTDLPIYVHVHMHIYE